MSWSVPDLTGRYEDDWERYDVPEGGEAAEPLMAALKLGGVDRLWFVSGSELTALQEAAAKAKVLGRPSPQIMTMIHEHAALCAALGESMITGGPAAACAHVELGLMNMGGAIHIAGKGGYPVFILTGAPATAYPGTGPGSRSHTVFWKQQIRDQGEIVRQYTKWDHKLAPYDNPGMVVTRALQVALTQPHGPVYLSTPRESLQTPISGLQRFPTLKQLTPASPPAPDPNLIREAAKLLIAAESPLLFTERLGRNPAAIAPFQELAELLGARVTATGSRFSFPQPHPLRATIGYKQFANVQHADVILAIDSATPWLPGPQGPKAGAKVIWIDIDPIQQGIGIWEYAANPRITADPGLAIVALLDEVKRQLTGADRDRLEQRRTRLTVEGLAAIAAEKESIAAEGKLEHISQRWSGGEVARLIDDETIVIGEGGYTGALTRTKPGTQFFHGAASLGFSLAAAIGAKLAAPDKRIVTLMGDGAYNFALASQCFWAAKQYKTPFVTVVSNNRGFGTGTVMLKEAYPDGYSVRHNDYSGGFFDPPPDYVAEAQAAGCFAERVRTPDALGPALERAIQATDREGVCSVIDVWMPKHITGEV